MIFLFVILLQALGNRIVNGAPDFVYRIGSEDERIRMVSFGKVHLTLVV